MGRESTSGYIVSCQIILIALSVSMFLLSSSLKVDLDQPLDFEGNNRADNELAILGASYHDLRRWAV